MSSSVSIMEVAKAAGVSKTTVSRVLNGKLDRFRIGLATQARVRTIARQMGYQPDPIARNVALGQGAPPRPSRPPISTSQAPTAGVGRRQLAVVLAADSPATTLALLPGIEPVLAAADYRLVMITVPAEPAAASQRVHQLIQEGIAGLLCCPTIYQATAATTAGRCPVIVLWAEAAKAMLVTLNPPPPSQSPAPKPPPAAPTQTPPVKVTTPPPVIKIPAPAASAPSTTEQPGNSTTIVHPVPTPVTPKITIPPVIIPAPIPQPEPDPVVAPTPEPEPFIPPPAATIPEPPPASATTEQPDISTTIAPPASEQLPGDTEPAPPAPFTEPVIQVSAPEVVPEVPPVETAPEGEAVAETGLDGSIPEANKLIE